jgi:hypothetical protein
LHDSLTDWSDRNCEGGKSEIRKHKINAIRASSEPLGTEIQPFARKKMTRPVFEVTLLTKHAVYQKRRV